MPHVCEYLQRPEETFQLLWSSSYKKMWFGTTWEHHTTTYRKTIKHYQLLSHLSNPLFFKWKRYLYWQFRIARDNFIKIGRTNSPTMKCKISAHELIPFSGLLFFCTVSQPFNPSLGQPCYLGLQKTLLPALTHIQSHAWHTPQQTCDLGQSESLQCL